MERLADTSFKTDEDGNTLFYPWGILGKGYIIKDKGQEERIRKTVVRYYLVTLIPLFLIGVTIGWPFGVVVFPGAIAYWTIRARMLIRGLETSNVRLAPFKRLRG